MLINQVLRGDGSRGLFTQASPDALLSKVVEVIREHGRHWQRDRYYWRGEGHPPSLNANEDITTDNHFLTSEQAPGLRAFVRMTWHPQPERPAYPECFFLVDFEQTPVFTKSQWAEACLMSMPGPAEELLRTIKQVTVRIRLEGLTQRRRDKPWFLKGWPKAWGKQPMKKAEQERLHAGPEDEDLLAALDALPRDVSIACALINQGMLEVTDLDALPSIDEWKTIAEQEAWSEDGLAYQATFKQLLASRKAPIERQLWINPREQEPDDIRMLLLLILLQEEMISDDTTRNELELWAVGYLRCYFNRLSDHTAYEVLIRLQREFVYPEDWRAFLKYTGKVVRGVLAENRSQEYGRHIGQQRIDRDVDSFSSEEGTPSGRIVCEICAPRKEHRADEDPAQLYSIPQVLRHLCECEGLKVVRSTLYRWSNEDKVQVVLDKGQKKITPRGVGQAITLALPRYQRKTLKDVVAAQQGIKEDSAKRHIWRRQQRYGETLEDIAKARMKRPKEEG